MKRVIITNGYSLWKDLFRDVEENGGKYISNYPYENMEINKLIRLLYKLSYRRWIPTTLLKCWMNFLEFKWFGKEREGSILFLAPVISLIGERQLKILYQEEKIKTVLLMIDSCACIGDYDL